MIDLLIAFVTREIRLIDATITLFNTEIVALSERINEATEINDIYCSKLMTVTVIARNIYNLCTDCGHVYECLRCFLYTGVPYFWQAPGYTFFLDFVYVPKISDLSIFL